MSDTIETVRIVAEVTKGNPHGYSVINACDLTDEHVLWRDEGESEAPKPTEALVELMASDELTVDDAPRKAGRPRKG